MKSGKGNIQVKLSPGQFIFGRESAAKSLHWSPSSIRNRMDKLENIGNLVIEKDRQFSIVSIVNWDTYQSIEENEDSEEDRQRTGKGQAKDRQRTGKGQAKDTNNKVNKVNKVNNIFIVPSEEEVMKYCNERQNNISASTFIDYYESNGWMIGKNKMKDWRASIRTWEFRNSDNKNTEESWVVK